MSDNQTDPNINRNEHDDTGGVLAKRTKSYVWNSSTLAWDKMTQPSSSGGASDIFPATQNITAQDIATSTVAGFNGQSYVIGNPTANSAATFTLGSIQTAAIQITGIWTGTLRIEASVDGGTTYSSKFSRLPGTVYAGSSAPTSNCLLLAAVSNYNRLRIRASTAWTGTAVITVTESVNEHVVDVLNPIRLLDSTTSTLMTIKPASTAPIASDTSVVVGISPNSIVTSVNSELADTTGTVTNATQTTPITATSLAGYDNVLVTINGTYTAATATFQGSDDGGVTWYNTVVGSRTDSAVIEGGYTSLTSTVRAWNVNIQGFDSFRVNPSAVATGTVNVRISPESAPTNAGATMQLGAALPAGSAVIGHVIADSGSTTAVTQATGTNLHTVLDSGTLTTLTTLTGTTTLTPGTGATNLGKAEDAPHTTGDSGVFVLGVRNDTATALAGTTLDYIPITTDANGATWVSLATSIAGEDQSNNLMKVSTVGGLMPTNTALNTYSVHVTSNTTNTPTSSTAYISSIAISTEVAGTTSTVTIQDKQGTPLKLVNALTTVAASTAPQIYNFQTPIKMTSGIDVITAGAVASTIDVWINYFV